MCIFLFLGTSTSQLKGAHSRCWLILSRPCVIHVCICVFCSGFRFVVLAAADSCPCATQTCHLKILFLCSGMPRLALKPATRELLRLHRLGRLARFQLRFQPVAVNPCQSHSFSVQARHHTSSFVHRTFRSRLRARRQTTTKHGRSCLNGLKAASPNNANHTSNQLMSAQEASMII